MSKMSRDKGARGELEAAAMIREFGFEAHRGVQHAGGPDSQDVKHNVPGVHFEVKRTEALGLYQAIEQAKEDRKPGDIPTVLHKRNKMEWLAILPARSFLGLMKELCDMQDKIDRLEAKHGKE